MGARGIYIFVTNLRAVLVWWGQMSTAGITGRRRVAKGFGWQAALILLPVLALAAVGIWALRQDQLASEQEAKERAQALADDVAQRILTAFFPKENGNPRLADLIGQAPQASSYYVFGDSLRTNQQGPSWKNLAPQPSPVEEAELPQEQKELLRRHSIALRQNIKELGDKN